jgi:ABC-type glycerol-3-phosphate transport system substrate-binding protein
MHPRRWLQITVALAAVLALATACSSGPSAAGGGGSASGTLRLSSVVSDRAAIEAVVKAFKAKNPGVNFTTSYADTDPYQSTLRTQLSAGTAPDVFFAWPGNGNAGAIQVLAPPGYLADLSGRPWVSQIPEAIKPVTQVGGKTYIVPATFVGIAALYNKTAMDQAGLKPPTTWTELLAFCDAAKAKGKIAFALGNQTPWITQLIDYALVPGTVYATDKDFDQQMQSGSAHFVGSGWQTAMDKYLQMNQRGCFQKDPLGTSFESSLAQVAKGQAIAAIQVTSILNQIKSQAPAGTQFGLFPVPATDDPSQVLMPGAAGGAYAINAKTKNKDLATKFIDFLASPEGMDLYATTVVALPAIPNDQYKLDPALQPLLDAQKTNKTIAFMDQYWPNPKVQQVHFSGVQDLFAGKAKPAQVLAQMDQAYQQGS